MRVMSECQSISRVIPLKRDFCVNSVKSDQSLINQYNITTNDKCMYQLLLSIICRC